MCALAIVAAGARHDRAAVVVRAAAGPQPSTTSATTEPPATPPTTASSAPTTTEATPLVPSTTSTTPPTTDANTDSNDSSGDTITSDEASVVRAEAGTSGTHKGITLEISAELSDQPGGVAVHVHVHAASGAFGDLHVSWGDNSVGPQPQPFDCRSVPASTPVTQAPFEYTGTVPHLYALAGTYHLEVSIVVPSQCPFPDGEVDHWSFAQTDVTVPTGFGLNGPLPPQLQANTYSYGYAPRELQVFPEAWDDDGWIQSISLDWGDGSPVVVLPNTSVCLDHDGQSFATGREALPGEQDHVYATAGSYTVTLRAVSTSCDGSHRQTADYTIPFVAS